MEMECTSNAILKNSVQYIMDYNFFRFSGNVIPTALKFQGPLLILSATLVTRISCSFYRTTDSFSNMVFLSTQFRRQVSLNTLDLFRHLHSNSTIYICRSILRGVPWNWSWFYTTLEYPETCVKSTIDHSFVRALLADRNGRKTTSLSAHIKATDLFN